MQQVHVTPVSQHLACHRNAAGYKNYGERLYVEGRLDAMRKEKEVRKSGGWLHWLHLLAPICNLGPQAPGPQRGAHYIQSQPKTTAAHLQAACKALLATTRKYGLAAFTSS
jgi:hypothetical protein